MNHEQHLSEAEPIGPAGAAEPAGSVHERHRRAIVALIPRWYSPAFHLAFPTLVGLAVLVAALSRVHDLRPVELLAIPATLLVAFAFEWRVHKSVLHRRVPLLDVIYERHELQHHVIYTYDDMAMRERRELWLILVPAYAVLLIGLINAPLAYLAGKLLAPNVGLIFLVTSMWFFITYEWLHLAYHLPPTHPIGRLRLIGVLREHHRRHHDPRLMKSWNFNVTVPLFDWIHRTTWTTEREAERAAAREARKARRAAARQIAGTLR